MNSKQLFLNRFGLAYLWKMNKNDALDLRLV